MLKARGEKREVFRVADMTIEAARSLRPSEQWVREAEAQALICGRSWVYQRVDELDKAETFAKESLDLGELIGYPRNTAFCQKCMGRLMRIRAERSSNGRQRKALLKQSTELLTKAIRSFSELEKFGPDHEEVGDCYSLLGRTRLLDRDVTSAEQYAAMARDRITNQSGKDYMDLLILEGEIAVVRLDRGMADAKFGEAARLADPENVEKSEVAARALMQRGLNIDVWKKDSHLAAEYLMEAREIWDGAEEDYCAAVAELGRIEVAEAPPAGVFRRVRGLPPMIAVEAIRLWRQFTAPQHARTLAQRSDMTEHGWKRLMDDAKRNVALRRRHWRGI